MKAARSFYAIVPVVLIALLVIFVMTGCKDQENTAIAKSNSHVAVPIISRVIRVFALFAV